MRLLRLQPVGFPRVKGSSRPAAGCTATEPGLAGPSCRLSEVRSGRGPNPGAVARATSTRRRIMKSSVYTWRHGSLASRGGTVRLTNRGAHFDTRESRARDLWFSVRAGETSAPVPQPVAGSRLEGRNKRKDRCRSTGPRDTDTESIHTRATVAGTPLWVTVH